MAIRIVEHNSFGTPVFQKRWDWLSGVCSSASLFTTRLWCQCWHDTLGQATRPVILEAVDDTEGTVGLLPLCVDQKGPVRWLKFMGRDRASGDYLNMLATPGKFDECLSAVLSYLDARPVDCDGMILGELGNDSKALTGFVKWAEDHAYMKARREHRLMAYIDLPESFDAYLATLKKKSRHRVRYIRRGMEAYAHARITLLNSVEDVDTALSEFFALHQLRWQSDGLPGIYNDEQMRMFLMKFCRLMAAYDGLRIFRLAIDDQPQAILISFHWRGAAHFYQIGRHPACPVMSPGSLVIAESIEQAIQEGLARYEFLRGDEAYKFFWTKQFTEQCTLVIGQRWPARTAMTAEACKDGAKQVLQRTMGEGAWNRLRDTLKREGRTTTGDVYDKERAKT